MLHDDIFPDQSQSIKHLQENIEGLAIAVSCMFSAMSPDTPTALMEAPVAAGSCDAAVAMASTNPEGMSEKAASSFKTP